jgi:hypothetical protein
MANPSGLYPRFKTVMVEEVTLVPNNAEGPNNSIPPGVTAVRLAANTNDANDFTVLPPLASVPVGHRIVICAGAVASELRTPATSGETINNLDCDGTNEMLMTAANTYQLVKRQNATAANWIASGQTNLGAAQATILPHA